MCFVYEGCFCYWFFFQKRQNLIPPVPLVCSCNCVQTIGEKKINFIRRLPLFFLVPRSLVIIFITFSSICLLITFRTSERRMLLLMMMMMMRQCGNGRLRKLQRLHTSRYVDVGQTKLVVQISFPLLHFLEHSPLPG